MNKEVYIHYLNDSIKQLIELARDKSDHESAEFEAGKRFGLYSAVSRLLNQAESFQILDSLDDDIASFSPESMLSEKI